MLSFVEIGVKVYFNKINLCPGGDIGRKFSFQNELSTSTKSSH